MSNNDQTHRNKKADGALLGLAFMESIAADDKETRNLIFGSYPSPEEAMAEILFSVTAAFNFLLEKDSAVQDVDKLDYIRSLRQDYLDYAEMLRALP